MAYAVMAQEDYKLITVELWHKKDPTDGDILNTCPKDFNLNFDRVGHFVIPSYVLSVPLTLDKQTNRPDNNVEAAACMYLSNKRQRSITASGEMHETSIGDAFLIIDQICNVGINAYVLRADGILKLN